MKLTIGQLTETVNEYIDQHILPLSSKMPSVEQLMFGIKVGVIKRAIPQKIADYLDSAEVRSLGVVTDDGVDIDTIYQSALETMQRLGTVQVGELRFVADDVETLYKIAKAKGGNNA